MRPILLELQVPLLGRVTIPAYFGLLAVGFTCVLWLTWRDARRQRLAPGRIVDLNLYAVLWGLLGARMLHVLADGHLLDYVNTCIAPESVRLLENIRCARDAQCGAGLSCNAAGGYCYPARDCLLALKFWRGGLSYYGGFVVASAALLLFIRRHRLPLWRVMDLAGYGIPLGLFWGRVGCLLNGCCYGKVSGGALAVTFPPGSAVWRDHQRLPLLDLLGAAPLPVHPTQLYSALTNLVLFALCYCWIRPRKRFDGQVFLVFVALYAISRFALELLRDDERGMFAGLLSTSQLLSLPLLVAAVYLLRHRARRSKCIPS